MSVMKISNMTGKQLHKMAMLMVDGYQYVRLDGSAVVMRKEEMYTEFTGVSQYVRVTPAGRLSKCEVCGIQIVK